MTDYVEDVANILQEMKHSLEIMQQQTISGLNLLTGLKIPERLVIPEIPRPPLKNGIRWVMLVQTSTDKYYWEIQENKQQIGHIEFLKGKNGFWSIRGEVFRKQFIKPGVCPDQIERVTSGLLMEQFGLTMVNKLFLVKK